MMPSEVHNLKWRYGTAGGGEIPVGERARD